MRIVLSALLLFAMSFSAVSGLAQSPTAPTCQQVCDKVASLALPADQLEAFRKEHPEVLKEAIDECLKDCQKLDETARSCMAKATDEQGFNDCERAWEKRTGKAIHRQPVVQEGPDCDAVCGHLFSVALERVSEEDKAAAKAARKDFMEACVPGCKDELDKPARECLMKARTEHDIEQCAKEAEARESAANPTPPTPDPAPQDSPAADVNAVNFGTPPGCDAVCKHIMDLALAEVPAEQRAEAEKAVADVMKQCLSGCETDLDDQARACYMAAQNLEQGEACDKAHEARRMKNEEPVSPE